MKAQRILFPTDFSPASAVALPLALSLARETGATLVVAHVNEPPTAYSAGDFAFGWPMATESAKEALEAVAADEGVPVEHHLLEGEPIRAIVKLAADASIDLIVMGTHGRSGLRRLIMGSVAEGVVRGAHCPVLTYRQPAEELAESSSD